MRAKLVEAGEKNEAPTDASGSPAFYCGLERKSPFTDISRIPRRYRGVVLGLLREGQIRLMTNSHKSQSEKLATGGGRETTAEKPDNN